VDRHGEVGFERNVEGVADRRPGAVRTQIHRDRPDRKTKHPVWVCPFRAQCGDLLDGTPDVLLRGTALENPAIRSAKKYLE